MHVSFHKNFDKRLAKLPSKIQHKTIARIQLFRTQPFAKILDNHALGGKYSGSRSIDITGDYRAIYEPLTNKAALFIDIGTHSKLYG